MMHGMRCSITLVLFLFAVIAGAGCRSPKSAPGPEAPLEEADESRRSGRKITEVLTRTPGGRAIEVQRFIGADPRFRVLIFFSIHGDERPASELAVAFGRWLDAHPEAWREREVCFIPAANPDGLAAKTRVNAAGIDVNRNFPARSWQQQARGARYNPGPHAGSEVETLALVRLIDRLPPDWIVSVHAPLACVDWDGPAEELAKEMAGANGLPARKVGYPTPGSFGSWAGIDRGIPVVTLELDDRLEAEDLERQLRGLEAAIDWTPRQAGNSSDS